MSKTPILVRIRRATQRILENQAPMRIPVSSDDVDIVLGDCANHIISLDVQLREKTEEIERLKAEAEAYRQENITFKAQLTGANYILAEARAEVKRLEDAIMPEHDLDISFEACCGRERSHSAARAIRARRESL